jgi:putative addiction module component (TIGR02574 family)
MSALLDQLAKQSRLLTVEEKATLARILIDELDPSTDREVEELWIAEAQRRYQAYLNGQIEAHAGDEVMTRARNRLR